MPDMVPGKVRDFMCSINKLNVTAKYNRGKIGSMPKIPSTVMISGFVV